MIHLGDLFTVLPTLKADSFDVCITDGPYGLGFMRAKWDTFSPEAARARVTENTEIASDNPNLRGRTRGVASSPSAVEYDRSLAGQRRFQAFTEAWAREIYRVLKPGAYLVSFGAPRSYHRMAAGLEDAAFEVRDSFSWLFGQGYPKSVDVARAIDMALCPKDGRHCMRRLPQTSKRKRGDHVCAETALGKRWAGFGSGLKPSNEPICIARKPLDGTLADNVLKYGAGALNVAACRLSTVPDDWSREKLARHKAARVRDGETSKERRYIAKGSTDFAMMPGPRGGSELGRWPSNVLLDQIAADILDDQTGELVSGFMAAGTNRAGLGYNGAIGNIVSHNTRGDRGGASRFFYVAKPSRKERDRGCGDLPMQSGGAATGRPDGSIGLTNPRAGAGRGGGSRNIHPTIKPIELMRWLVRLVTPPGGHVLDPFLGSGTTGMACRFEGRKFTGIEREAAYVEIARRRIASVRDRSKRSA